MVRVVQRQDTRRAESKYKCPEQQSTTRMDRRTVFFVSDQTGVTAETMGHSLLTQFDGQAFRQVTLPFISTVDKAQEAVRRINATAEAEGVRPVVFSTLLQEDLREIIKRANGLFLDFFDAFLGPLELELKTKSSRAQGKAHGMADLGAYTLRINATNFALANDDGAVTRDYERADLILVGVSRSGKTPTCLYMALQYGIFAANYPLTEEELESARLPPALVPHQKKLYGLTIAPERLQQIRNERRPNSRYSSSSQVEFELRTAESIFKRYDIPCINTTECSIEEIASRILDKTGLERRLRP
jgi:[pyruvate, water dikinase]-phosphate phosphotransferase / [pyruvate, water dikinase] kinase